MSGNYCYSQPFKGVEKVPLIIPNVHSDVIKTLSAQHPIRRFVCSVCVCVVCVVSALSVVSVVAQHLYSSCHSSHTLSSSDSRH